MESGPLTQNELFGSKQLGIKSLKKLQIKYSRLRGRGGGTRAPTERQPDPSAPYPSLPARVRRRPRNRYVPYGIWTAHPKRIVWVKIVRY